MALVKLLLMLLQVASMIADFSNDTLVVPGGEVNGADDMTGDLEVEQALVLYVSGEESVQQVTSLSTCSALVTRHRCRLRARGRKTGQTIQQKRDKIGMMRDIETRQAKELYVAGEESAQQLVLLLS